MEYRIVQDEPMTNEELVQAARASDKTALEELVKKKDAKIPCKTCLPVASFGASMWNIKLKVGMI